MNNLTETSIQITPAANGYIVNKATSTEAGEGDTFNVSYDTETYVFTDWDEAMVWLNANGK